jgi:hypothetical protein
VSTKQHGRIFTRHDDRKVNVPRLR